MGVSPFLRASQVALVINPPVNTGDIRDASSTLGSGRSPGEGHDNPLQYSCLENLRDRGAWKAAVHGVTKRQRQLSTQHWHTCEHVRAHTHTHTHTHTSPFLSISLVPVSAGFNFSWGTSPLARAKKEDEGGKQAKIHLPSTAQCPAAH